MTDALQPGENLNIRYLLQPCRYEDIERIMRGNVADSRMILPDPWGTGFYFTSDPTLCAESFRQGVGCLLVCQVLLGTYTLGARDQIFPRRYDGRLYDSLVDDKDKPCAFMIKDIEQCYPAFVVKFSCTSTSNNHTEAVTQGSISICCIFLVFVMVHDIL